MNRRLFSILLTLIGYLLSLGGNAQNLAARPDHPDQNIPLFSANPAGDMPTGWAPLLITRSKKLTRYELVAEQGKTVLHAHAVSAASGLMHQVSIDPQQLPWLSWRWKTASLIATANNFQSATEDSPVRIVLAFDGDKDALSFSDRMMLKAAKFLSGQDLPYATLMYIWENQAPAGTVIANKRASRVQMVVAASGTGGIGQWQDYSRNIVDDYERAFGEKPGRLIGVGVLTDTDNTGETVEAWYGDIRLLHERHTQLTETLPAR